MARADYEEIKNKFSEFVRILKERDIGKLEDIFEADVKCYLSCAKAYADGSQHSVYGIKNFITDIPETDFFHTRISNFICRIKGGEAQQAGHVVCLAGRYGEKEPVYFLFNLMFSNHWIKRGDSWKISEVRMDILPEEGNFSELEEAWYFEDRHPKTYPGVHYPCINGELDSPWYRIQEAEDVLTEEEKVAEAFYRYAFGIDHLVFAEVEQAICEDVIAKIQPWGPMDKRMWIEALKYHRQRERQWGHCGKIRKIKIEDDKAYMTVQRLCGHKQREHAYVYTNENVDTEHACAMYEIELRKTDSVWKIKKCEYFLGLLDLGKYEKETEIWP